MENITLNWMGHFACGKIKMRYVEYTPDPERIYETTKTKTYGKIADE